MECHCRRRRRRRSAARFRNGLLAVLLVSLGGAMVNVATGGRLFHAATFPPLLTADQRSLQSIWPVGTMASSSPIPKPVVTLSAADGEPFATPDGMDPAARPTILFEQTSHSANPFTIEEDAPTAWCVLDDGNTNRHFRHFPHAMESLSPCWSYFCRVRAEAAKAAANANGTANANANAVQCGVYYNRTAPAWSAVSAWARDLVATHLGCRVVTEAPPRVSNTSLLPHSTYRLDRPRWFDQPSDVVQLRLAVLGEAQLQQQQQQPRRRRIGIVQRVPRASLGRRPGVVPNRVFLNALAMEAALRAEFATARVVVTDMAGWGVRQQAYFWNRMDVIVAAHGAAVTNAMFMRPDNDSALVEIYPDDYAPYMFQGLTRSCRVRHYTMRQQNASAPAPPFHGHPRNVDLAPNVTLMVELVRTALHGLRA